MLILLALSACTTILTTTEAAHVEVTLPEGRVIDPKLDGAPTLPIHVLLEGSPRGRDCEVNLRLESPVGQVWTWSAAEPMRAGDSVSVDWAGLQDAGEPMDPGPVQVLAFTTCEGGASSSAAATAHVVRLGVVELDLVDHPEDLGLVPLAYHKLDLLTRGVTPIEVPEYQTRGLLGDLDGEDGWPLGPVEPWLDPDVPPPWGQASTNVPAAVVAGARLRVLAVPGTTAVSPTTRAAVPALSADAPDLRLRPDGLAVVDPDALVVPGEAQAFELLDLPDTLGRHELEITWRFQARSGDGWVEVPGQHTTRHVVYLLLDHPVLADGADVGAAPPIAWVGVLDDLSAAVAGLQADEALVLDAVRDFLHLNPWLVYNPGDSAYTDFEGPYIYWESITADVSGWLDRQDGVDLYCHSMSCLLSTLAGSLGADAPQQVLGVEFTTNLTRAAGSETWRRWGFNSHSVVSPDDGAHFWDASIDLDGDEDPAHEPVDPVSPKGMDGDEYLWRLSYDDIGVVNTGYCYVL